MKRKPFGSTSGRDFKRLFPVIAIAVAMVFVAPSLRAQEKSRAMPAPRIAVIDFQRAVRESAAGQSIIRQINDRHAGFQKEIGKVTAQLETSRQELGRQQALLAPEIFRQKRKEFQTKAQRYQKFVQQARKKLDVMFRQGMKKVELKLAKVLREIANERGANIVIDAGPGRGNVLFTDALLVVTDEAKTRLNAVLPDVKVVEPEKGAESTESAPRLNMPGTK